MTRSQVKKTREASKTTQGQSLGDDVSRDKLIAMQQQDSCLTKFMKETEQDHAVADLDIYFKIKNTILYKYCKNVDGQKIYQYLRDREKKF